MNKSKRVFVIADFKDESPKSIRISQRMWVKGLIRAGCDVQEKLTWHLFHNEERRKIANAGCLRGQKDHTFKRRVEQIFDVIRRVV